MMILKIVLWIVSVLVFIHFARLRAFEWIANESDPDLAKRSSIICLVYIIVFILTFFIK